MYIDSKEFSFKNKTGEELSGRLETPVNPTGYAIFAHCFTCSKAFIASAHIAKQLAKKGIATLRFDFTGLGNSEGDFSNTNFSSNVSDLIYAFEALKSEHKAPSIMIGHSLGGAAVLRAAEQLEEIKAVVTIGAPSNIDHVAHLFKDQVPQINNDGVAEVQLAGRSFLIKKQFIDDLKNNSILESLTKSRKAHLIMHSPIDDTVSIEHASRIYSSLKHSKSFISLDNMDHLITNKADASYISSIIGSWVERYTEKLESKPRPIIKDEVLVQSVQDSLFTQNIYTKDHSLIADEPKSFKGDHLGMSPYELLQASLGACTSMTIKMYAARKKLKVDQVEVSLSHYKNNEGQDYIDKKIEILGDLTQEQKNRMIEIAESCPVNKTLSKKVIIKNV